MEFPSIAGMIPLALVVLTGCEDPKPSALTSQLIQEKGCMHERKTNETCASVAICFSGKERGLTGSTIFAAGGKINASEAGGLTCTGNWLDTFSADFAGQLTCSDGRSGTFKTNIFVPKLDSMRADSTTRAGEAFSVWVGQKAYNAFSNQVEVSGVQCRKSSMKVVY